MHAVDRSSLMAGVALVGASVIALTPVAPPPPPEIRVASAEVGLTAASSPLNIPLNLLIDVINIPHAEIQAINLLARAQIFSGPWFVVSPTNIWGIDPGDPPRLMATVGILAPFPALSGIYLDQNDQRGLGQQVWKLVAAELPVNEHCGIGCMPTVPTSPITGIRLVDSLLWNVAILTGQVKYPLFNNFFQVPLSDLADGFEFGPDYPGYADPSGPVYPGLGFPGTTEDPETGEHLMPWAGETFTLDLSKPFDNYFDHLMADPSTNPIQLPDLVELGRTLQTLLAGMVIAFDPITPGSPFCPGDCSLLPAALDYPGIVKSIADLWPGNEDIDEWLTAYEDGTANVPTPKQIERNAELNWGQPNGFWSFVNESPPPEWSTGFNLSTLAPFFHKLWTDLGLNPPPLNTGPGQEPENVDAPPGGPVNDLRAGDQISSSFSKDTGGLTGGTKAGESGTGGTKAGESGTGGTKAGESGTGGTKAGESGTGGTKAGESGTGGTKAGESGTGGTKAGESGTGGTKAGESGTGGTKAGESGTGGTKAGESGTGGTKAGESGTGGTKAGESGTGGTKAGESGTGGTKAGESGTGGTKAGESGTGGTKAGESGTGGTKAGESGTGGTKAGESGTGGRHRAE